MKCLLFAILSLCSIMSFTAGAGIPGASKELNCSTPDKKYEFTVIYDIEAGVRKFVFRPKGFASMYFYSRGSLNENYANLRVFRDFQMPTSMGNLLARADRPGHM